MYGARDDNALGNRRGNGIERHEHSRLLVQHHNVALAPDHLKLLGARHMRDVCGTVARGVNQVTAAHVSGGRHQRKSRAALVVGGSAPVSAAGNFNRLHRRGTHKRHAVGNGVFQRGDGDLKRVDVTGRRAPQRARRLSTRARLQLVDALGADNRQLVGKAILAQLLQVSAVFIVEAQYHRPGAAEQKA